MDNHKHCEALRSPVSPETGELRGHEKCKTDVHKFRSFTFTNLQPSDFSAKLIMWFQITVFNSQDA